MGYAGNSEPSYIFPTTIATNETAGSLTGGSKTTGLEDLNYFVGDEAMAASQSMQVYYPIRHGLVDNWTHMEKFVFFHHVSTTNSLTSSLQVLADVRLQVSACRARGSLLPVGAFYYFN